MRWCKLSSQSEHKYSLFSVDYRKIAVWRKSKVRLFNLGKVIVHAVPICLLIKSDDNPNRILWTVAGVLHRLHRIKARNHRTLVIRRSATIYHAIIDNSAIRLELPAIASRNDIKMPDYANDKGLFVARDISLFIQNRLACPDVIDMPAVVVDIANFKAHLPSHVKEALERVLHALPEGIDLAVLCAYSIGALTLML